MLVSSSELLKTSQKRGYAVCAFNFHNLEVLQAIVETAETEKTPVILQITPIYLEKLGACATASMARGAAEAASVPIALHLDHSNNLEWVNWALDHGFTSVMIDGSKLPLDENIAITTQVVKAAQTFGASVEAEIGSIGGVEDSVETGHETNGLADPIEALSLVKESGINALAPAVGTAHGLYSAIPNINFELISKIKDLVTIPLVLHGGSGIPNDMVKKAINNGMSKINVGTELKVTWAKAMAEALSHEREPWKAAQIVRRAVREVVKQKLILCGSIGKA